MSKLLAWLAIDFVLVQIRAMRVQTDFEGNLSVYQSLDTDGGEAKQSVDTGPHRFQCRPTLEQPPPSVSDTSQMKAVLSGVKQRLGISSRTWVIWPRSPLFVAGLHGTTTYALSSMLKSGIQVSTALRATGRSLLSEGFYMYSMGWGYEGETPAGIDHMIQDVYHYCSEAQTNLKRSALYVDPGPPNPAKVAAKQAYLAASKAGNKDGWVDQVIIFLGANRKLPSGQCTHGFSLRGGECAVAYNGAKHVQDENRYVDFGDIPDQIGYVVGPKMQDKAVELVAKSSLARNLAILGYFCVSGALKGNYVANSGKLKGVAPHCLCSPKACASSR